MRARVREGGKEHAGDIALNAAAGGAAANAAGVARSRAPFIFPPPSLIMQARDSSRAALSCFVSVSFCLVFFSRLAGE